MFRDKCGKNRGPCGTAFPQGERHEPLGSVACQGRLKLSGAFFGNLCHSSAQLRDFLRCALKKKNEKAKGGNSGEGLSHLGLFVPKGGRLSGISAIRDHACLTGLTGKKSNREARRL